MLFALVVAFRDVIVASWCGVWVWLTPLDVVAVGARRCGVVSRLGMAFGCWGRVVSVVCSEGGSRLLRLEALSLPLWV